MKKIKERIDLENFLLHISDDFFLQVKPFAINNLKYRIKNLISFYIKTKSGIKIKKLYLKYIFYKLFFV